MTYDDFGGYGHPDHIQAHRVAMYAAQLAAAPTYRPDLGAPWDIPKIYWTAISKSMIRRGVQALRDSGDTSEMAMMDPEDINFGVDDELITTRIDGRDYLPQKIAAMHAYPTQIDMGSGFFSFAELPDSPMGIESFRLIKGTLGQLDSTGHETDLFAGIANG
jgi:N-acetyl-1-D-myo-inositol-2-amino-2-deoxy-alpha-D-glucopyranoside deacetylase